MINLPPTPWTPEQLKDIRDRLPPEFVRAALYTTAIMGYPQINMIQMALQVTRDEARHIDLAISYGASGSNGHGFGA